MSRCESRSLFALAVASLLALSATLLVQPAEAQKSSQPDLTGYRTVDKAIVAQVGKANATTAKAAAYLGIHAVSGANGKVVIDQIDLDSPAAKAGLKQGDLLASLAGQTVASPDVVRDLLKAKAAGEAVQLGILRNNVASTITATLAAASQVAAGEGDGGKGKGGKGGFDTRGGKGFKKSVYRLAIIGIEYSDVKHNAKITAKDWETSMFSEGVYNKTSVTGQKVHGSMHDYYKEQSFGKLKVEGKMFPFVQVSKKRMDYAQGNNNKTALFNEACDKIIARDGKDAFKNFDGVFFIYAGGRANVARGSLYWPHRSSFNYQGKSWPYFIVQEGSGNSNDSMNNISVFCHEFGHMLGLPDLYARPENPGSEGVGQWCAMSNQVGNGRPQHFCVWSKEQLGWATPTLIDPTVKQKLILSPINDSPKECFKVLARADGSEYYLLENRKKKGFDTSVPAEGLLIWRVVGNRPILEESHGVEGPSGPRVFMQDVPFPSKSNDAFTPYTIPSSRSQLGGGLPVFITNIRRLPDGRITFHIGYEYL